jgi:glycosyltransferase involved in cell wall biosynthesis
MLVSVIVPAFNRPVQLRRALRSVIAQDYRDIEVIVVDDRSEPPVALDLDDGRLRLIRAERNGGPAAARNLGIAAAQGEVIAFLDSDDAWLPGKLRTQVEVLQTALRADAGRLLAVTCGFVYPDRRGRPEVRFPSPAEEVATFASGCWHSPGSTALVVRAAFARCGGYDERLRRLEDLDWFLRFGLSGGRLVTVPHAGAVIAPSGAASTGAVAAAEAILRQKFGPGGPSALPPAAWRRLRAYLALERGAVALAAGERWAGAQWLLRSWLLKPRWQPALERFGRREPVTDAAAASLYQSLRQGDARAP